MFSRSVCSGHCFCTETSFVFTQQLALWRVQVRHSASWKARSLLFSLPENGSACVSILAWPLRCLFPPPLVPARRRQRAPQGACLSLQCKRRYTYNALRQNQKRCVGRKALPSENSTTKGGGVFRDTGASMRICFHRECFCMQTVTQSASRLTVTPCNAHTPHAGTSTRGEGKRHRSGQARTHRRFRSRARDRNLRSGTNTNSTAFRRCSDRSEPRSR